MAALKVSFDHLMKVPGEILSVRGIADSTGFVAFAAVQNYVTPMLKNTTYQLPGGYWIRSLIDGAIMKGTFVYGTAVAPVSP